MSKPLRRAVKRVARGTLVRLELSRDERNLVLHNWSVADGLPEAELRRFEKAERPELRMTLRDWAEFCGWVAATGNHARSGSRLRSRADRLFGRIQALLESHVEEQGEPDAG
jgi:hypothetical protein